MQLISILFLVFSIVLLLGAIAFVALWHRTYRKSSLVQMLREDIGHIGVSAIVAYPKTSAPLIALLEEEYPHSEAVIITDLQSENSSLEMLIGRYRLMKVNHSHLEGVRALYRSRHRAFRRVVMVDLPEEHREMASAVGKEVASYENLLCLEGESIVERNSLTYCANVAAAQSQSDRFSLCSFVGTEARFGNGVMADSDGVKCLRADYPLAWRKSSSLSAALLALILPSLMVAVAHISENRLLLLASVIMVSVLAIFLYISSRAITDKSLFARLDAVVQNFYRFWSKSVKKYNLYPRTRVETERGYSIRVENSRSAFPPSSGARMK
jgi:hypothetical protein